MTIKNKDLELLIELEDIVHNYSQEHFDNCCDILNDLLNLNERLINQRDKNRKQTAKYIAEKRKTNPEYAGHKRKREIK